MAAGAILAALANIPWGQVVDNAPKLAEGAARLMRAVAGMRKPAAEAPTATPETPGEMAVMQREVATLRHTVGGLQEQLQASSQLLKELTEQNLQLIRRVELNRVRLWWTGLLAAVALLAALGVIIYLLAGRA